MGNLQEITAVIHFARVATNASIQINFYANAGKNSSVSISSESQNKRIIKPAESQRGDLLSFNSSIMKD